MLSPKYENPRKSPFVELLDQILPHEAKLKELAAIAFDTVDVARVGFIEREELVSLILQMGAEVGLKRPAEQEVLLLLRDLKKRSDLGTAATGDHTTMQSPGGSIALDQQTSSFTHSASGTQSASLPVKIKRAEFVEMFWILMTRIKETEEELQEKLEEARMMKELLQD